MNEFLGYILANVEHMNDSIKNVQKAVNKISRGNRYILLGSAIGLGLGFLHEKRIRELKNSLREMRNDINHIQTRFEEG